MCVISGTWRSMVVRRVGYGEHWTAAIYQSQVSYYLQVTTPTMFLFSVQQLYDPFITKNPNRDSNDVFKGKFQSNKFPRFHNP